MIIAEHISFKPILSDLDFKLEKGKVLAVIGHNGAGKTTLFHVLLGLKFKSSGTLSFASARLGFVPERPYLDMHETFGGFLDFHMKLIRIPASERTAEAERVSRLVGLQEQANKKFKHFSKGMLQKAVLAQAMLGHPELIVLDEPMSGLDPQSRNEMGILLHQLKKNGVTLLFSSHAMEDVESLADEVLVLDQGKQIFFGSVVEWKNKNGGHL